MWPFMSTIAWWIRGGRWGKVGLKERGPRRRIEWDEEEIWRLDVEVKGEVWRIRWADVRQVAAWKEDVFAYDIIFLGFRVGEDEEYLVCNEQDGGWKEVQGKLRRRFGIEWEKWWSGVAFPAFAMNWTELWVPHAREE